MGNLLRILLNNEPTAKTQDIFVDFENTEPTADETPVYTMVKAVLDKSHEIIKELRKYAGATELIRLRRWRVVSYRRLAKLVGNRSITDLFPVRSSCYELHKPMAISNPSNGELQENALEAVSPLVQKLKRFYEFSLEIENVVPHLLGELCSESMTAEQHLESQQALFKQFAEILDFVLTFDDLKMTNPAIQNDFSYYRRTVSRKRLANEDTDEEETVSNELANRMSLFYAHATPMLKTLSDATAKFVSMHKELPVEQTTDCLKTMANICRVMIENPQYSSRFTSEEAKLFCLRVMVGVIILYDHVHPVGAFIKTSGIDVKSSIKVLKDQGAQKVEGLINALRYTTKHLQEETTPKAIKQLLSE